MAIKSLTIRNFRIHKSLELPLRSGITVITGPNGSGKTSILEAVSLLASSRSFRAGASPDFIRKGEENAHIAAHTEEDGLTNIVALELQGARKRVFLNEKAVSRRRQIAEILPFVVFSPSDHRIVEGDAADRRQFLNRAISNLNFNYADHLRDFQKVLTQRNSLLKANIRNRNVDRMSKELEVWDEQFLHLGGQLVRARIAYLEEFRPHFAAQYRRISQRAETLGIDYLFEAQNGGPELAANIENHLGMLLKQGREKDIFLGTTNSGPQRDDLSLTLDGNRVKFYGSQGEKRSAVLALRLAEVQLFREKRRKDPILLIDDVSSELDITRRQALVDLLKRGESQVLITATELPADLLRDAASSFDHVDLEKQELGLDVGDAKH